MTVPPIVHMNGTAREDLLDQRFALIDAITAAGDALAKAAPNARDYYPKGPEYTEAANRQHDRRTAALKAITAELYEEIEAIQA